MWHYVVIEIEHTHNGILMGADAVDYNARIIQPCWNIVWKVEVDRFDRTEFDFTACEVWVEQNRVEGSKYAIIKMYLI